MPFAISEEFKKALEEKEREVKNAKPEEPTRPDCTPNEEGVCEVCSS